MLFSPLPAPSSRLSQGGHAMTKQISSPNSVANAPSVSRPFAVALLGLGMASFAFAPAQSALGATPTKTPAQEESVLVATREVPGHGNKN